MGLTDIHKSVTIRGKDLIFIPKVHNDKIFHCMSFINQISLTSARSQKQWTFTIEINGFLHE